MRRGAWLPPVLWMALILAFASDTGSAEHTGRFLVPVLRTLFPWASPAQVDALHGLVRKLAHFTEYAVLAALWLRAFTRDATLPRGRAAWIAWALATAWAVVDETVQSASVTRTGSALDVGIDTLGALAVAVPAAYGWRVTVDRLTRILLWIAAAGGGALLSIDLAAGVPPGALWATVPAAVVALLVARRWRRRA